MFRKSLTHLLILCYSIPMFLGHGGLHALFGVEHHCSHHHSSRHHSGHVSPSKIIEEKFDQDSKKSTSQSSCSHHHHSDVAQNGVAQNKEEGKQRVPPPSNHHPIDEKDCTLCHHVAQGQLASPEVEVELCENAIDRENAESPVCEVRFITSHVPRGPPRCC